MEIPIIDKNYKVEQKVVVSTRRKNRMTGIIKDVKRKYLIVGKKKYLIQFTGILDNNKPVWVSEERILFRKCV